MSLVNATDSRHSRVPTKVLHTWTRILTSSTLVTEVGEAPEVAEAHAVADTGEDELEFVAPVVSPGAEVGSGLAEGAGVGGTRGEVIVVHQPATRTREWENSMWKSQVPVKRYAHCRKYRRGTTVSPWWKTWTRFNCSRRRGGMLRTSCGLLRICLVAYV